MENQPITLTVEKAHYVALLERAIGLKKSENGSPIHEVFGRRLSRIGSNIERTGHNEEQFKEDLFDVGLIMEFFHLVHS